MIKAIPNDPMLPKFTNKCRCMACGEYFKSSGVFDLHRRGPPLARYCLTVDQMLAKGMVKKASGHWIRYLMPVDASTRRHLAGLSLTPTPAIPPK